MITLRVVGSLYLVSGLWCLFQPALAAGFLSIALVGAAGLAEFVTVYGGLQIGLGLAMWSVPRGEAVQLLAALRYSAIVSLSLCLVRLLTLAGIVMHQEQIMMATLEVALAAALLWSWYRQSVRVGLGQ